ncbi:right-handed parallel beta-helix repeat-containing protein [Urechidicola croceus]|uniref:Right handed beta helix domain-containing protein n=1 Tax=Urechidicola croceus TaxID=1850246 RepID=A0A1D8P684_9FLAO|nr:right-handed parallel beta-helix repeat-containing protein [Urechidicola croceus]AOW20091.1 hypothetical protein LPB138_05080 [Urechidicola croceus]
MKHLTNLLFVLLLTFSVISCTEDQELITNNTTEEEVVVVDETRDNAPCNFDFSTAQANETITIGCNHDLNGQTINLPTNVTIEYNGGSITNGTLVFDNGLIDGKLLNINLEVGGSTRLIDTEFHFEKSKWNITEGQVSDEVALTNRLNVNTAITQFKALRGYTFVIDNIDFFVNVTASAFGNTSVRESIILQSNMEFKMGPNCDIRVQPNGQPAGVILGARFQENLHISGSGRLWGDRFEHTYTTGVTYKMHDSGFGITFIGVRNSSIDGITMSQFTGDGFFIHSWGRRNADGSVPAGEEENFSSNITVKNCTFAENRRNNLSFVDCVGFVIENNIFEKAALTPLSGEIQGTYLDVYNSDGVIPGNGIDFEAWRQYDENGAYHTQFINDGIVRNNIFRANKRGDLNLFTCSGIEVYGNEFENGVSNRASFDISIHDNIFVANPNSPSGSGISIKSFIREGTGLDENTGHKVYNNTISGPYDVGIVAGGTDGEFYNNTITGFTGKGVYLGEGGGSNNYLHDNHIQTSISGAKGYYNVPANMSQNGTIIEKETIITPLTDAMVFKNVNNDEPIVIKDIDFNGKRIRFDNSSNFVIQNCDDYTTILQNNSDNIEEE